MPVVTNDGNCCETSTINELLGVQIDRRLRAISSFVRPSQLQLRLSLLTRWG